MYFYWWTLYLLVVYTPSPTKVWSYIPYFVVMLWHAVAWWLSSFDHTIIWSFWLSILVTSYSWIMTSKTTAWLIPSFPIRRFGLINFTLFRFVDFLWISRSFFYRLLEFYTESFYTHLIIAFSLGPLITN